MHLHIVIYLTFISSINGLVLYLALSLPSFYLFHLFAPMIFIELCIHFEPSNPISLYFQSHSYRSLTEPQEIFQEVPSSSYQKQHNL